MNNPEVIAKLVEAKEIIEQCLAFLGSSTAEKIPTEKHHKQKGRNFSVDFSLNPRNFAKTYGSGLNGEKKFVLLLALLSKGKIAENIETAEVISLWSKMTSKDLLGYSYNAKYPTVAKTNGWIDSRKYGTYHLRDCWKDIFMQ